MSTELSKQIEARKRALQELFTGLGYANELQKAIDTGDNEWILVVIKKQFFQIHDPQGRPHFLRECGRLFPDLVANDPWYQKLSNVFRFVEYRHSGEKTTRTRPTRPKSPDGRKRERVILGAIQTNLRGRDYCRELDRKGLLGLEAWREDGWPGKYAQAYMDRRWRKKIQDEKHRFQRKYNELTPAKRQKVIEG